MVTTRATHLNHRNEKSDIHLKASDWRIFFIKLVPFCDLYTRANPYQDAPDNRSLLIKVKCCLKASFRMTTLYCGPSPAEITFIHRFRKIILEMFLFLSDWIERFTKWTRHTDLFRIEWTGYPLQQNTVLFFQQIVYRSKKSSNKSF